MFSISIIIPVYNVEKYLPACLESVYNGIPDGCQVILVDDGTPDGSGAICDKAKEQYPDITTVIHQENMGPGGARNTGIEAASGEYLMFVDSDDTLCPGAVQKLIDAIHKYKTDIISFPIRSVAEDGSLISVERDSTETDKVFDPKTDKWLLTVVPAVWNKVFRASLFKDSGIRFPLRAWYEDICAIPKLISLCSSVVFLNEPLYNYLQRPGSIMNSLKVDRNVEMIQSLDDLTAWFRDNGKYELYRNELEYLIILHIYLTATVRVIRQAGCSHPLIAQFRSYTKKNCTSIYKNPYVKALPARRRLALRLVDMKLYPAVKLLFRLKEQ